MAKTHDLGKAYWHIVRVPGSTPLIQLQGLSHEVEEPWRIGHCVLLRLPVLPWCLVLGWWGAPRTSDEMLAAEKATFISRHTPDTEEIRENFRPEQYQGSQNSGWSVR